MNRRMLPVIVLSLSALALVGCGSNEDLEAYIKNSYNQPAQPPEPLPEPVKFEAMPFEPQTDRSPFALPKPENIVVQRSAKKDGDCLQPDMVIVCNLIQQGLRIC